MLGKTAVTVIDAIVFIILYHFPFYSTHEGSGSISVRHQYVAISVSVSRFGKDFFAQNFLVVYLCSILSRRYFLS